ncbi:hypothetical protein C8F04DRAFT_1179710 [Mycena alexandri]|uniref:Uncharacterized protein n=1 Tax=Mycena alexandri TaxID=1745969 RepID=A0AAD6T3Y1_9AGAR|nr:hypothetical protein C8F04DRAFT_1179710 [Mycena alexandri]
MRQRIRMRPELQSGSERVAAGSETSREKGNAREARHPTLLPPRAKLTPSWVARCKRGARLYPTQSYARGKVYGMVRVDFERGWDGRAREHRRREASQEIPRTDERARKIVARSGAVSGPTMRTKFNFERGGVVE